MSDSVLFVLPGYGFGGAERVAADTLGFLRSRGVSVAVVALPRRPIATPDPATAWFDPICKPDAIVRGGAMGAALAALVDRLDPCALVLCGRSPAYGELPRLLARHPGLRVTGFQFNARQTVAEHLRMAPYIDAVIAESLDAAAALGGEGHLAVSVISSGVPAATLAARPRPASGGPLTIGYVGRFDHSKNPRAFLRLAKALRHRGYRFVMAGPAPPNFRAPGHVECRGLLLGEALNRFVDAIDILVVPSRNDGRPLVIQEAQARGIPVVAARVGGIPELIEDGLTGLLCPVDDDPAFTAAIERLATDPGLRERIGLAGQQQVLREGEVGTVLSRYAEVILGRRLAQPAAA